MLSLVLCCRTPTLRECTNQYLETHRDLHLAECTDKADVAIPAVLGIAPDLVVCEDLEHLTALELMEATARYVPGTSFLVCGVHREFDRILELLHAGVADALPEGWDRAMLAASLDALSLRIRSRQQERTDLHDQQFRRVLDKQFFEDTIVTRSGAAILSDIAAIDYEYQIRFVPGHFQALYLLIDPRPKEVLHADAFLPMIQMEELAREYFRPHCHTLVCYVQDHGMSMLLNTRVPIRDCRSLCRGFLAACRERFPWFSGSNTISIGVGLPTNDPELLPQLMQSAKFAGWMRLGAGMGRVLEYSAYYDSYLDKHAFLADSDADALRQSVKALDAAGCISTIHRCLDEAENAGAFVSVALSINDVLIEAFNSYDGTVVVENSKYLRLAKNMPPMVESLDTLDQIRSAVTSWAADRMTGLKRQVDTRKDAAILLAEQYISANFSAPLHLSDVAALVGLSTPYFCMKFRQNTGETFVEYMTELRMDRAQTLLLNTNYKIYEIAEAVGFRDVRHFSRTFHRSYGMLPTDYRAKYTKRDRI